VNDDCRCAAGYTCPQHLKGPPWYPEWLCTHCETNQHTTARHDKALAALRREEHNRPYALLGLGGIVILCIVALAYFAGLLWVVERFGGI